MTVRAGMQRVRIPLALSRPHRVPRRPWPRAFYTDHAVDRLCLRTGISLGAARFVLQCRAHQSEYLRTKSDGTEVWYMRNLDILFLLVPKGKKRWTVVTAVHRREDVP
jgi:hypothetical protein